MIRRHSDYRDGPELEQGRSLWWMVAAMCAMIVTCLATGALCAYLLKHYGISYHSVLWHPHHEIR